MVPVSGGKVNKRSFFLRTAGLALAAVSLMNAAPAHADNTFLLQLGTFDTEDQATKEWNDVKAKNGDVLAGLSLHIAEVALPPSGKASYRTQAGPVISREKADALCSQLSSRDVSCYVVETAMFASETAPDQPQDEAKTEAKPTAGTPASAPEAPRKALVAQEDTSHSDDPDYVPPPVDSGPIIISTSEAPAPAMPRVIPPAEIAQVSHPPTAPAAATAEPVREAAATSVPGEVETRPATRSGSDRFVPGREPRFLDQPSQTAVASALPPAPAAAPAQIAEEPAAPPAKPKRGFFSRLFGSSEPTPEQTKGVVGSVNVAEAVRVPLSSDNQPPKQKIIPVLPAVHGLGGYPDDSTAKTFWAQISYFRDESQALDFYRQFSATYPQFSDGVRIRITRPFASGASGRVSLRVGPFAGTQDVHTICDAANRWNARCTVVRDLGASAAVGGNMPTRQSPRDNPATEQSHGPYWAQLGTYRYEQDAWDAWGELRSTHHRLLGRAHATVTSPPESSATNATFRLRAGPYTSENVVSRLCARLQAAGAGCAVTSDR